WGSAQLSSSVGKLAEAATAAPRPAVLKKDLRDSMAGIVLWAEEKFNHKGHEGTRSSYSVLNNVFRCRKETYSSIVKKPTKDRKNDEINQPRITAYNSCSFAKFAAKFSLREPLCPLWLRFLPMLLWYLHAWRFR